MTAKSNHFRVAVVATLIGSLLAPASLLFAQEATEKEPTEREAPEVTIVEPKPEEVVAAIKRRAKKLLEARRAARRLKFYAEVSEAVGYETNPATSPVHKGDTYFEESGYFMLSKKLTSTIEWQASYNPIYLRYLWYNAGDYFDNILTVSKLRWVPGRMWRLESWLDLEYNYYPEGKDSGYRQMKTVTRLRQNLFGTVYHQLQYEYFIRDYVTKNARDGAGNETLSNRVDTRNRLRYKTGFTVPEALPIKNALFSVENDIYRNDSNDARQDFYDYDVWKITSSVSGSATKKLYLSGSFAFERKNYREREITTQVQPEARYDDKYTLTGGASYDLNKTWKVAYDFTSDHLGSNHSPGEYDNAKHAFKVTARF